MSDIKLFSLTGGGGIGELHGETAVLGRSPWIDESYTEDCDGDVGRVGSEINFNRYFYEYEPPRPLEKITDDIPKVAKEMVAMLGEVED